MRKLVQRAHVRSALRKKRQTDERAARILADGNLFSQFYMATLDEYVQQKGENVISTLDDDGNPILTKLLDFIKWMYESGFLEFLIGMFTQAEFSTASDTSPTESFCLADIIEKQDPEQE